MCFQLRHAGFTKALERDLPVAERARLHEALACSSRELGEQPIVVAHHLQAAGLQDEALEVLRPELESDADFALPMLGRGETRLWGNVLAQAVACAKRRREKPKLMHGLFSCC